MTAVRRLIVRLRAAPAVVAGVLLLALAAAVVAVLTGSSSAPAHGLSGNPNLDPGSPLGGRPAPDFTLTDQFGHPVSLHAYRGRVVLLAFNDSECTTVCPLTTAAMRDAVHLLGRAGSSVALLGVDANPNATSVHDVLSYSELHGMTHAWHFLTGSKRQLEHVWKAFGIGVEIARGQIDHTPALFVIDPRGRLQRVYLTQQSYAAVGQLAQLLAREASSLLPGRPPVASHLSYAAIPGTSPTSSVTLPRAGGGTLRAGPGRAHLYVFFATWDREVTNLARDLRALNAYAAQPGLPPLTAVDEGSVEPSPAALGNFLHGLGAPLRYPVAIDTTGRLADGYEVQDEPWFVLVSPTGRIAWYLNASTDGWPAPAALAARVRAALSNAVPVAAGSAAAKRALAGSPAPLAALHERAAELVGGNRALDAKVRALRGYPIVVNVWASSCAPCRQEFGLLESASVRYGRRVAFLGADYNDDAADARAFLAGHYVSYPSYQTANGGIQSLLPQGVLGTPTTFFVSPRGKVVYVHTGQYESLGTLEQDVRTYALGG